MRLLAPSLKGKLIGVILLSSVAASLITYAALLAFEFHTFQQDTRRNLGAMAGIIASNSSAALIYDDKPLAQENLAALRAEPAIAAAALYDQHGGLYATYPAHLDPGAVPAAPGAFGFMIGQRQLRLFYPVNQGNRRAGTLYLASNLDEMYSRFLVYGAVLLAVLVGSVCVSFFLSNFFQRRISRPILDLAEMAEAISEEKNYTIRARAAGADEFGVLTRAFNGMLDQIQASHADVERARDEAVAASRAKDDFLAALSHELRTPLNPVLLLASDHASRLDLPPGLREDFETIRKNIELEARLIDDLLDLTRITRGKLALDLGPVDPRLVLEDAIKTVRADADAKFIALTLTTGATRPMVLGDATRLQQVFWNVLKNAVKFTPEGGRIAVDIREVADSGRLAVTVADSGIGLTAEEIPRIFQVFGQGEHAREGPHRFGGLGLGLAISKTLAELHEGTIRATSAGRDRGATFIVDLPLLPAEPKAGLPAAAAAPAPAERAGAYSILLVEDHEPTRTVLVQMLENRGHRVLSAGSLAEARACAAIARVDVLISDIGLPDGSGYDLMAELSAHYPLQGIALTGYGMEDDVSESRAAGFAAHLTKPVRIRMIDEALAKIRKEPGA
jgi:signal transduction histidine kinase/CheY-like chemotaxis protein